MVFLAVGFETTTPSACLAAKTAKEAGLENFSLLTANKTMPNAYNALVGSADAFIYPGHVNAITGNSACIKLCEEKGVSGVVAGFTASELMTALAVKAIRPCTCPVFVDTDKRLYRIKKLIERNKVDGVIYHVLRGCLVYDYEYQRIEDMLEKMGVKVLRVETDYSEEDVEQLKIRLEAFLEVIKFSK